MGNVAIRIENVWKEYHIGRQQEVYRTLRDTLTDTLLTPVRRARKLLHGQATGAAELDESIWALKDVAFDVQRGEVVGIIGRNGAGKSTLLKILSRITEPTKGQVEIYGRVGSLLEVGAGFHPELTGRENIYLKGAILGMKKVEIRRKFDEIVAFAEVEKFVDTPVKHYSSGMYMRLAFAVAAHLEPEVLLVDEVLAVGDASFQKKCLNKMHDVGQQGRTVLFVSHNMPAINRLCERAVLLDEGRVVCDGPAHQIVSMYLFSGYETTAVREWPDLVQAPGNDVVRLRAVRVRTEDGDITEAIDIRRPVSLEMEYDVLAAGRILVPSFKLFNEEGINLFITFDLDPAWRQRPRPTGHYTSTAYIPGNFLAEGSFFVSSLINTFSPPIIHVNENEVVAFQAVDSLDGNSARGDFAGRMRGVVRPLLQWHTRFTSNGHTPMMAATKGETTR